MLSKVSCITVAFPIFKGILDKCYIRLTNNVAWVQNTKYCPNCGNQLKFDQAKFCPDCGANLVADEKLQEIQPSCSKVSQPVLEEAPEINVYELGKKLEDVVENIYKTKGYSTTRRQRIVGKSGTKSEIDIIARRGSRTIAIECKNYSSAVGIEKVRDFSEKLRDIELDGVFISLNGLTQDAEDFAEARHIETMDSGELMEKWWAISVGRIETTRGQSLTLDYALPVNVGFSQATSISLANKEKVRISDAELIFHPYFFAKYSFYSTFKDPTKNIHKFKDEGTLFVDALDGKVLNTLPQRGLGILESIKNISSSTARTENARTKKLLTELQSKDPSSRYDIEVEQNYRANKLKPAISIKQALNAILDFIVEKNTFDIAYTPKGEEDEWLSQRHHVTFVPKRSDIRILRKDVVVVPRWSIEFESLNKTYRKEILACSGQVLEDTMAYCPSHFKIGAFTLSQKRTIAVCEVCGQALCDDHVKPCAICGKWLCQEDAFECEVCKHRFCKQHKHIECLNCGGQVCNSCVKICPICHHEYSAKHSVACDKCGRDTCPKCLNTSGFIKKTRICADCS